MNCNLVAGHVTVWVAAVCLAGIGACTKDSPSQPSQPVAPSLTAPVLDSPSDDQQLTTLQPSLRVSNASSTPAGARTYEFQVSSNDAFTTIAASAQSVSEGGDGKTSWSVTSALQPTTRFWWRARAVQSGTAGPWSSASRFRSKVEGVLRAGELNHPLGNGETVSAIREALPSSTAAPASTRSTASSRTCCRKRSPAASSRPR